MEYNKEISDRRKQEDLHHKQFLEWCHENGVKFNAVDVLAYFGQKGELRGVAATRDLTPYEVLLAVPNKILITTPKIREDLVMKPILASFPDVFRTSDNSEYYTLLAYILKERALKEKSFYHPFFNMVTDIEPAEVWEDSDLKLIQSPDFRQEILDAEQNLKAYWEEMSPVLKRYRKIFGK